MVRQAAAARSPFPTECGVPLTSGIDFVGPADSVPAIERGSGGRGLVCSRETAVSAQDARPLEPRPTRCPAIPRAGQAAKCARLSGARRGGCSGRAWLGSVLGLRASRGRAHCDAGLGDPDLGYRGMHPMSTLGATLDVPNVRPHEVGTTQGPTTWLAGLGPWRPLDLSPHMRSRNRARRYCVNSGVVGVS